LVYYVLPTNIDEDVNSFEKWVKVAKRGSEWLVYESFHIKMKKTVILNLYLRGVYQTELAD